MDRYDGPAFRVLRKYLGETAANPPVVMILSAKFGLIEAAQMIPDYDCCMSTTLARHLQPRVLEAGKRVLGLNHWQEVGVCVSKQYGVALDDLLEFVPEGAEVGFIGGGLGRRLTALRAWLCRAECVDDTVAPA